jgi:hypothetical protein
MKQVSDAWYIRLPDGRVLRAANTAAVRTHVTSGRIPPDSRVCRGVGEEWVLLEWTQEFADLARQKSSGRAATALAETAADAASRPAANDSASASKKKAGVAARLDPLRLQTIGVRGLVDELLAALDSTLVRHKIVAGCIAGVITGVLVAFVRMFPHFAAVGRLPLAWLIAGVIGLVVYALCNVVLAQMTFVELSRLRPARWSETVAGLPGLWLKLFFGYVITAAIPLLGIRGVRWLAWQMTVERPAWLHWAAGIDPDVVRVVAMMIEMVLWPMLSFAFLLAPILVVEDCSVLAALVEWWRLLQRQIGRVFLYEALATTLGTIATLPFCIPLALTLLGRTNTMPLDQGTTVGLHILAGLAAAPLIAYLAVANVFIYLNLRYDYVHRYD